MITAHRPVTTGKGIHARRRVSLAGQQPLKPRYSATRSLLLLIVFCASLGVYVQANRAEISQFVNRPVSKVIMDQNWQQLTAADISRLLSGYMGRGFFQLDVDGIKVVLEQHPWVAQASVQRIWPDSLALQITEHSAIARWGESQLLNQYGEIFQPPRAVNFSHLPRLRGPADSQFMVMQQYQKFSQILFPTGMKLSELYLSSRGSWELTINDSMQVAVGRKDLTDKLERFLKFYKSQPPSKVESFQTIDLRYGNGIAVKSRAQEITGVAIR